MSATWYVYRESGETAGPMTLDKLARGVMAGELPRTASVAAEGDREWRVLSEVPEIAKALRDLAAAGTPVNARPLGLGSVPPPPAPKPPEPKPTDIDQLIATSVPLSFAPAAPKPLAPPAAAQQAATAPAAAAAPAPKAAAAPAAAAAPKPMDPALRLLPFKVFGGFFAVALVEIALSFLIRR